MGEADILRTVLMLGAISLFGVVNPRLAFFFQFTVFATAAGFLLWAQN